MVPVCKANILVIRQWSVTLRCVAFFPKHGKMFSQADCGSPTDVIFAFSVFLCLMQDLVHNVLISI